jgi:hypothetical protein
LNGDEFERTKGATLLCALATPANIRQMERLMGKRPHCSPCPGCRRKVMVSDSSVSQVASGEWRACCADCFKPEPVLVLITTEQGDEELARLRARQVESN